MEIELVQLAQCTECGWCDKLEYADDIEVGYPSHGTDPDWVSEKACPVCGSTWLETWMVEA